MTLRELNKWAKELQTEWDKDALENGDDPNENLKVEDCELYFNDDGFCTRIENANMDTGWNFGCITLNI